MGISQNVPIETTVQLEQKAQKWKQEIGRKSKSIKNESSTAENLY
jgi:hypothetical protein